MDEPHVAFGEDHYNTLHPPPTGIGQRYVYSAEMREARVEIDVGVLDYLRDPARSSGGCCSA